MIVLFTDYGHSGPYLGQLQAVLRQQAPGSPVVNLSADAPRHNPRAAAYLLAAWTASLVRDAVYLCVVDPGVGTWQDAPVMLNLDGRWYVGPDNGLFDIVGRRAERAVCRDITWRPERISASFHGRDLYAPVAAQLALGHQPAGRLRDWHPCHGWPNDLTEVVYIDGFGNAVTGMRAGYLGHEQVLSVTGRPVRYAETFGRVPAGTAFWCENSSGLIEIAVNAGSAAWQLGLTIGDTVRVS